MPHVFTPAWRKSLFFVFCFLTALSILYPPYNSDSARYSQQGNPFTLQWLDYAGQSPDNVAFYHGRYLTHTLLRGILQTGEPWLNLLSGLILTFIFFSYLNAAIPRFYKETSPPAFYTALLLFALLFLNLRAFFFYWFLHAHFCSNGLSMALILCFLSPYHKFLSGEASNPSPLPFYLLGSIAGSLHEQGAAVYPLLGLLALFLYIRKIPIPKWYWLGLAAFSLGFVFLLIPTGNAGRIIGYGGGASWQFMGQSYNWLDLGWKRYLYSFLRHFVFGSFKWLVLPYLSAFAFLCFSYIRRRKSIPIGVWFYFFLFLFSALVMTASPVFSGGPEDNALFFLIIALCALFYDALKEGLISFSAGKATAFISGGLILTVSLIQGLMVFPAASEYRRIRGLLIEASRRGESSPLVPKPLRKDYETPFGLIKGVEYEISPYLLKLYGFNEIRTTNSKGESFKITPP